MSRRAGSPTPFILGFLVLALISLIGHWRIDVMRKAGRHSATVINNDLRLAEQGLAELRGAQAGYLAVGQKPDEWMTRATSASVQLETSIADLAASTSSPDAHQHYQAAAALVTELTANDRKARVLVASGQELVASDVLFQEGADPTKKLAYELTAARDFEMVAFEKSAATLGWISLGANGAALAIGLLLLFLATRGGTGESPEMSGESDEPAREADATSFRSAASAEPTNDPFAAPSVDLSAAADLCVDLGRILDARDLQNLMARAATVMEAKGLVVWVIEAGGTQLRPSLAHGYSDRVLQRMGTLPASGDNVTSLAFRTLQPQVLRSSFDGHGALAVPLITSSGCVGVLAAEVQGAKPGDVRFAVARMIAAQLSTIVGPGSAVQTQSASGLN